MEAGPDGMRPFDATVDGFGQLSLARIDADHKRVALFAPHLEVAPPVAVLDFSTKPLINLVWLGALLAVLGTSIAGLRRAAERTPLRERAARPARASVATG
jgi:hypothetical protein